MLTVTVTCSSPIKATFTCSSPIKVAFTCSSPIKVTFTCDSPIKVTFTYNGFVCEEDWTEMKLNDWGSQEWETGQGVDALCGVSFVLCGVIFWSKTTPLISAFGGFLGFVCLTPHLKLHGVAVNGWVTNLVSVVGADNWLRKVSWRLFVDKKQLSTWSPQLLDERPKTCIWRESVLCLTLTGWSSSLLHSACVLYLTRLSSSLIQSACEMFTCSF